MIPQNNNLLPSLNNYQIQTTTHLTHNLEHKSVESSNRSYHDRILNYLIEKGMIYSTGRLTAKSEGIAHPALSDAQLARIKELLNTPLTIQPKDKSFEIVFPLKDLFTYLKLDSVEIVGGTVFWILGEEYMRQVCKSLEIPDEFMTEELFAEYTKKAADIDIRVFGQENLEFFNLKICYFLAGCLLKQSEDFKLSKDFTNYKILSEKATMIQKNGFKNFLVVPNEDNHFGIVSFGDIDLICVDTLKRKNLFKHDACKIVLSDLTKEHYCQAIQSNSGSILEPMVFRLTKILDADVMHEINFKGSAMLFCYLTKGWRYFSESLESTLLTNFLESTQFTQLVETIKNHFPLQSYANEIFCFNTCQLMPADKNLILNVTKQLLPTPEMIVIKDSDSALELFKTAMTILNMLTSEQAKLQFKLLTAAMHLLNILSSEQGKLQFKLLTAYFQVFASLSESKEMKVIKTKIKNEPALQIKLVTHPKALYLTLKDDLGNALTTLKEHKEDLKTSPLAPIFQKLAKYFVHPEQSLNICEIKTGIIAESIKELSITSFDLLESNNALLQQTGFYLLCHAGVLENNPNFLMHLLKKLGSVLNNEDSPSVRKTLIYSLFKYWQHVDHEAISKVKLETILNFYENAQKKDANLIKLFCCTFSTFEVLSLNVFIFELWEKNPKNFDFETSCQLIKNLKSTSPSIALKILKKLSESKDNVENLKIYFDMLVKEYSLAKNSLIAPLGFSHLVDIAEEHQFANSELINKILKIDFEQGLNLIHKKSPLNQKSNAAAIQERLELLVQVATFESPEIALEIRNVLEIYFKSKKGSAKKIKEILEPKYEQFLLCILKDGLKNPKEAIQFYVKVLEILTIDKPLTIKLHPCLMALFTEVLLKSEDIKFVKDQLKLVSKPTPSQEEAQLYYLLIILSLKTSNTEIADAFIKKIIETCAIDHKMWDLVSVCLKQHLKKSNVTAALELLKQIAKVFPENPIQNNVSMWKGILASLNEKQILKKLEILNAEHKVLATDESCLKMAEETVLSLIKNPTLLTNKSFEPVLELIKAYQLNNKSMICGLKNHFKVYRDKKLLESIVNVYLEMNNPFYPDLAPLFYPLSLVGSELSINFQERYPVIFALYEGEDKKELYQDFTLGLLNLLKLKSVKPLEIQIALTFIEKQSEKCGFNSFEKQNEIDLNFVRGFVAHPCMQNNLSMKNNLKIYGQILVKLKLLATDAKKHELAEILQLFFKALPEINNNRSLQVVLQAYISEFLKVIKTKVSPIDLLPYFDYINENKDKCFLDLDIELAINIVKSCPTDEVKKLSGDFLKFKPKLKEIIEICLKKEIFTNIYFLINRSFFSWEEIYYYNGKISHIHFNLPDIMKSKDSIIDILDFYIKNLRSPAECSEFQQKNMQHAINFLTALIFDHKDFNAYLNQIENISNSLFCYLNPAEFFIPEATLPYLSFENITYIPESENIKSENLKNAKLLMKEKTYHFFIQLTKQFSNQLIKHRLKLEDPMSLAGQTNISHLYLLCSFPEHRNDIIAAALTYFYSAISLWSSNPEIKGVIFSQMQSLVIEMKNRGLFFKLSEDEFIKKSIKLTLFTGLPVDSGIKGDQTIAQYALEMIKEISIFDEVLAYQYYDLYKKELLEKYLKDDAEIYEKKLAVSLTKKNVKISEILDESLSKCILFNPNSNEKEVVTLKSDEDSDDEGSGEYTCLQDVIKNQDTGDESYTFRKDW